MQQFPPTPDRTSIVHTDPQLVDRLSRVSARHGTTVVGAVVLCLLGALGFYWKTTIAMMAIWERSETFAHGFIVIPIFLYLLWRQRDLLGALEVKPYWPALLGLAGAGVLWTLGELVSAVGASQFGMVAMVPFAVWALLGTRIAKALAFPLAFLFFAVPFGEFLVPKMMDWTADFTVIAIRASGVPIYRDGNWFMIPSGTWSIVEACSGLRYLIASFMVGFLFAYFSYRSLFRRTIFIIVSLAVPIVANWVRAYLIVMLGHLSNNRLATGIDHVIYGWVFFGVVMLLLFWIGSRWREDMESEGKSRGRAIAPSPVPQPAAPWWRVAIAVLAIGIVWHPVEAWLSRDVHTGIAELVPPSDRDGWVRVDDGLTDWQPDISGAAAALTQVYERNGVRVGLHVAFFRNQTPEAKAVTTRNQLVRTTNLRWRQAATDKITVEIAGRPFATRTAVLASGARRLAVWQWYWVDGHLTANDYWAKLYQVPGQLLGHGDPAAWVIVFAPTETDEMQVRARLEAFTADMRPAIDAMLERAAAE